MENASVHRRIARRYRAERRFRWYGRLALLVSVFMLAVLLTSIFIPAVNGFRQTQILLEMDRPAFFAQHKGNPATLMRETLGEYFSEARGRSARKELMGLLSFSAARALHDPFPAEQNARPERIANWLPASDAVDMYAKGNIRKETP